MRWFYGMIVWCCVMTGCMHAPRGPLYVGAFLGDAPSRAEMQQFAALTNGKMSIVLVFAAWETLVSKEVSDAVYQEEQILMVTWEPWYPGTKHEVDYHGIVRGKYDEYIRLFARHIGAIKRPVLLRFAHEMNGDWYPWSGVHITGEEYQQMFRSVWRIFREEEIHNVRWIWALNNENVPSSNSYMPYYPGNEYVDYIGIDGYNWGNTKEWSSWKSFDAVIRPCASAVYQEYRKPIVITECGSTSRGGDKAEWIRAIDMTVNALPYIKALIYFNVMKETDWYIDPLTSEGQAFRDFANKRYVEKLRVGEWP